MSTPDRLTEELEALAASERDYRGFYPETPGVHTPEAMSDEDEATYASYFQPTAKPTEESR